MTTYAEPIHKSGPLEHFEHGFNRVAISADDRFLATSDVDMNVIVREHDEVVFNRNFGSDSDKIRPTERVRGLGFSPDGAVMYLAAGSEVIALNTSNWEVAWSYEPPRSLGFLIVSPIALDVAQNGDVAAAFDNGTILIWDGNSHREEIIRDNDSPRWMRFVANGSRLVGSDGFCLCQWTLPHHRRKLKLAPHSRVFGMDAHRSGQYAAVRSLQEIAIWDLREKERTIRIPVGPGIPVIAFHPHEDLLAYAERSRIIMVDAKGTRQIEFDQDVASALSICFTPKGDQMLIGCTEQTLIRRRI